MGLFRNRFPDRSDLLAVLGIAVFVCYSWSLLGFLNKLSSFILYFTLAEIADIFVFMMAFSLLESLAVTGFLVLLSAILPTTWLREGFALKGFIIIIVAAVTSILFQRSLGDDFPSILILTMSAVLPLVLTVGLIAWIRSRPKVQNIVSNIQDRILIMLFIYVPIGLLSLVVILYRNLL